jgi:hypothetical protein
LDPRPPCGAPYYVKAIPHVWRALPITWPPASRNWCRGTGSAGARIEVPLTIRLDRLHLVLQAAMGRTNSHLYEFRARDIGWGA